MPFGEGAMESRIDEIGAGIYRLSIFVPEVAAPAGFTDNHFLTLGEEPLLFHCGRRKMFHWCPKLLLGSFPLIGCAG
jgi:hypothetical protein